MHAKWAIFLIIIMSIAVTSSVEAGPDKREFRAMWVITWEVFRPNNGPYLQDEALKNRINEVLDNIKKGGLNAVLWQVRQGGTVYYPSAYEPWGKWTQYKAPGFDPLAFAITAAHARGLEFHAWINTFEARDKVAGSPAQEHPDWICTDREGKPMPAGLALSPGIKAARNHIQNIITEVARLYPVDGIHLDYIRWSEFPMGETGYPANALPSYQFDRENTAQAGIPSGFESWNDWRRAMVTQFMRELRSKLSSLERKVVLSVAAIGKYNWGGWNGYHFVGQDAALWFNQNLIDHLMPMNYAAKTPERLQNDLDENCPSCWFDHIRPGLDAGRKYSVGVGSLMLRNEGIWQNHPLLLKVVREKQWVSGLQYFSYRDWEMENYWEQAAASFSQTDAF